MTFCTFRNGIWQFLLGGN